nr:MAG TPA: hypothetical protein [Caudoviricetes sp.]
MLASALYVRAGIGQPRQIMPHLVNCTRESLRPYVLVSRQNSVHIKI